MLLRLFTSIVTTLFLIATHGQSHSAEITRQSHIPEFFSERHAVKYWTLHCQDPQIDRDAVRERFSYITFHNDFLQNEGFDPFDVNDYRGQVFSNIGDIYARPIRNKLNEALMLPESWIRFLDINCVDMGENKMVSLLEAIGQSSVTDLILRQIEMTPQVGGAFVRMFKEDKKFELLDLKNLNWGTFGVFSYANYELLKNIGKATVGKVDQLRLDQYSSTLERPFDFDAYGPRLAFQESVKEGVKITLVGVGLLVGGGVGLVVGVPVFLCFALCFAELLKMLWHLVV